MGSVNQAFLFVSERCFKCRDIFKRYNNVLPKPVQAISVHDASMSSTIQRFKIKSVPSLVIIFQQQQQFTVYRKVSEVIAILDSAAQSSANQSSALSPSPHGSITEKDERQLDNTQQKDTSDSYCGYDGCNIQNDFALQYDRPFAPQNSMAEKLLASGEVDGPAPSNINPRPQTMNSAGGTQIVPKSERVGGGTADVNNLLKDFESRRKQYDDQIAQQNEKAYKMGMAIRN